MAKTFKRVCIKSYTVTDGDKSFTIERAKEYITSPEHNGTVTVFTQYWIPLVPVEIFAGEIEFT